MTFPATHLRFSLFVAHPRLLSSHTVVLLQASFEAALAHMVREDPSLVVEVDEESGQTVLKGIGELHLEVRAVQQHGNSTHTHVL